jgi:CRISPR/Cas system CSM-associated protein Csm2 small subunit
MAEFNIRTDAVDVEQIMRQIRARIQSKRGVDYTEEQIQELASVKLERFLDPKGVRSDLVEQFKRARDRRLEPFQPEQYSVDANDLYGSSRGLVRFVRKLLNPILKLLLNTNRLVQVLHQQSQMNVLYEQQFHLIREKSQQRDDVDVLYYELVHNLVLELTRVGIENRNLKMRLESLSSRMDFDERRARALETVVQYRPGTGPARELRTARPRPQQDDRPSPPPPASASAPAFQPSAPPPVQPAQTPAPGVPGTEDPASAESNTARRRRRRRRGRRGGRGRVPGENIAAGAEASSQEDAPTPPHGDPTADAALDEGPDADFDDGPAEHEPDPSAQ